jgi:2-polyprenyl-3-methyl-5-hydroxy-6-metoxy-1,4-benzoquinol methylase
LTKAALEERISDTHYRTESEYERSSKRFMRALVPPAPPLRILDVGCGTGLNAGHLVRQGHEVVGIDLSPIAIEKFRARGYQGIVCDIEAGPPPFSQESFDLVYASEVIEHCVDTMGFLRSLHGLLKPGGTMLLSTPNSAFWAYRLLGLLGRAPSEYQHPGHVRFFSKRSLASAVSAAGFEIAEISGRHMYLLLGRRIGDPIAAALEAAGMQTEPRFVTGDHFWQLSAFARRASGLWADTLILTARKRRG